MRTASAYREAILVASVVASVGLCAAPAPAWQPPPTKQPVPLRLDESPALPLLAPFRWAEGVSVSSMRRYLDGQYGRWVVRPWQSLRLGTMTPLSVPASSALEEPEDGWGAVTAPPLPSPDQRLRPLLGAAEGPLFANAVLGASPGDRGPAVDAWLDRAGLRVGGWPLVLPSGHWFQSAAERQQVVAAERPLPGSLHVSRDVVPDWLRGLAPDWASSLLATSGCGRGGTCSADVAFPAQAFDPLWTAMAPKAWPIPTWKCRPRAVTIGRFGRETDRFELVRCDGSIAPEALDRLAIIARPTDVERPGDLLPDDPDPSARSGEWLPGIRLMSPRLLWVLQEVANAFPYRPIYIYSGYRPAPLPPLPQSRASYHWLGRALDLHVQGVPNEELFRVCHELEDVGCGFYPNKPFVHVDVRPYGHGRVFWIDVSHSGERAQYVDDWPGVAESGAMAWAPPLR